MLLRSRGPTAALRVGAAAASLVAALVGRAAGGPPEIAAVAAAPVTLDGGISIKVTSDQRATLVGESTSLRAALEEVCRQARVDLRGYRGPEHRYIGKLENVPLDDAFRSLLREESYVLGMRAAEDGSASPRIVWIRVLGAEPAGAAPLQSARATEPAQQASAVVASTQAPAAEVAPAPAVPAAPFMLPSKLLFEAFNLFEPSELDAAQRQVIGSITDDPAMRDHFLATDAKELANLFRPYRDAPGTVKRLQSLAVDRQIQVKLGEVVRALDPPR